MNFATMYPRKIDAEHRIESLADARVIPITITEEE
jgi:hypothetical protein